MMSEWRIFAEWIAVFSEWTRSVVQWIAVLAE